MFVFAGQIFQFVARPGKVNNYGFNFPLNPPSAYGRHKIIKNDTFEDLVFRPKYFWPEIVLGPKCALNQSMLGAKVSVGAKWSWGQLIAYLCIEMKHMVNNRGL
jgi:hypothetical protein